MTKNMLKVFEDKGFCVDKEKGGGFFITRYTPAGEDWGFHLDKLEDIKQYAEDFDVDEEFEMWVEAKKSGFEGVPSYCELYQDQLWKQKVLNVLASFF